MITELKSAGKTAIRQATKAPKATVLLVEDDSGVRNLLTRLLEMHGYRVLSAASSSFALTVWKLHQNEIHLLLTDVVMPDGISGHAFAQLCLVDKPGLPVIYASGHSDELPPKGAWPTPAIHFVQKPYRPQELLKLITEVLEENSESENK